MWRKATIGLVVLGVAMVWTPTALAVDDIVIPDGTVIKAAPGSLTELANVATNPNDVGQTCQVTVTGLNQSSKHLGNDLIIASNGTQVVAENVEVEPNAVTPATGLLTIGTNITVTLLMGPDGVLSGGLLVSFDCEPVETTTTTTTTSVPPPLGKIGDYVWLDNNSNGLQDAGEPGIGGVTVTLFNGEGAAVATSTTASDGLYPLFENLPADDYKVTVDVATAPGLTPTTPTSINVELRPTRVLAGTVFLDADFGFVKPAVTTTTTVPQTAIDLALTKSVNPASVSSFGSQAVFTVTVTHQPFTVAGLTQVNATGVVVGDVIPAGLTYVSDTSGGAFNPTTGQWNIGNLAIGASKSFSFTVTVDGPSTSFTNTAEVIAAGERDIDSTPNNNVPSEDDQDSATVVVVLQATPSTTIAVPAPTLPVTGATSETPYLASIGALLLLLGGALVLSVRPWARPERADGRKWYSVNLLP